jgi:hypothetical protein
MTIGDTSKFAVEYEISGDDSQMGFGRIWIENNFIGTFEDIIYLNGYLLGVLYSIKQAKELREELKALGKNELFELLHSKEHDYCDDYRVRRSTFTDDFNLWCYTQDHYIFILWKVTNHDFFKDLKSYTKEILLKAVSIKTFEEVIAELENSYRQHGISTKW